MDKLTTCCFTGHRPESLYFNNQNESSVYEKIYNAIESAIKDGYTTFVCGAARGADILFAQAVISIKRHNHNISLVCVLPCRDQSSNWCYEDRDAYSTVLDASDSVICLNDKFVKGCMHQRNRYMVDRSSLLIAAYNGNEGGTQYTVGYAKRHGLKINNVLDINLSDESGQISF